RTSNSKMFARFRPAPAPTTNIPNIPSRPRPVVSVPQASMVGCTAPGAESCAVVPVVLMVTVTAAALAPGVTEAGLTAQVENAGTPAHASVTVLEKVPPTGLIDIG